MTGTLLATFYLLEMFGTRLTLWAACLVNALIAVIAWSMSHQAGGENEEPGEGADRDRRRERAERLSDAPRPVLEVASRDLAESPVPATFVLTASAVVGFAFLLMELVWYRILSPILGGSTFTFGLILAVALLGIGLGGAAYALFRGNRTERTGSGDLQRFVHLGVQHSGPKGFPEILFTPQS